MFIPTFENTKTVTDLREDALGVLAAVEKTGFQYVMYHSKPKAIMLDIDQFKALCDLLEDRQDEIDAKKALKGPRGKGIPLETVMKQYA